MLKDITVLDLSRVLAGPYCSMMLADLGAEVIKIESARGDDTRAWGPPFYKSESAYYLSCNRNKKSVVIDIRTKEGQEVLHEIAKEADVVIENFKVGGLKKYNLDYDTIKALNPSVIYCSITGYGQDGPYKDMPGYDFIIQGLCGLMSITGEVEGQPMKVGVAITDILAGLFSTIGILSSLHKRGKTGKGEYIDVSLLDTAVASMANVASSFLISGENAKRYGNAHPSIVPYETFMSKDGYFNIGVGNNGQFGNLCRILGHPELAEDERFLSNTDRVKNRVSLSAALNEILVTKNAAEWLEELQQNNVPAGPINTMQDVFENEQVLARGMITKVRHQLGDWIQMVNSPIKYKDFQYETHTAPPLLGEHTEEILERFVSQRKVG
ncbi:MAG: CoA transferase [SAR324 cluster bacterium]|uniref:CoA transferase n=1 Tax=SAR324 cluster bacterium TaxID=2024889 RepID=A0A2A4T423_9DELT|nr:MAG: CoA transferase [SAR324 cluster bacterium]